MRHALVGAIVLEIATAVVGGLAIALARCRFVDSVIAPTGPPRDLGMHSMAEAGTLLSSHLYAGGGLLVVGLACVALAIAARGSRTEPWLTIVGAGAGLLGATWGAASLWFGLSTSDAIAALPRVGATPVFDELKPALASLHEQLGWLRAAAPLALGMTGLAAMAVSQRPTKCWLPLCSGILATGLAAFASTRGHARDAARPVPLASFELPPGVRQSYNRELLHVPTCRDLPRANLLSVAARVQLDGRAVSTGELAERLRELRAGFDSRGRPPTIVLEALREPPASYRPLLEVAAAEGYRRVHLLVARTRAVRTATMATRVVHEECGVPFTLTTRGGVPLEEVPDLRWLARRAARGDLRVRVGL